MNYFKLSLWLCLLFCLYCCEGNSQNQTVPPPKKTIVEQPKSKKINYINLNQSRYFTDRIDFKNEAEEIIASYDVAKNNPYNQIKLKDDGYNTFGGKIYPLKDITPTKYQEAFGLKTNARSKKINFVAAESHGVIYQKAPNYALVAYNLVLYDGFGETYEAGSEMVLLDEKGKEVQRLQLPHIARVPLVTNNGKYLFANYGGTYSCSGFEYVPQGFKVYNTKTGKMIYEESREGKINLNPFTIDEDKIDFSYRLEGGYLYKTYNFENKIVYTRAFTRKELGHSSMVNGGIKVKGKNENFIVLTYEKDFDKTSITLEK
jgi:hypothetical protein